MTTRARTVPVNGAGPIFRIETGVYTPQSGFAPIPEHEFLHSLADALRAQQKLDEAIANMRRLLAELDHPSTEEV